MLLSAQAKRADATVRSGVAAAATQLTRTLGYRDADRYSVLSKARNLRVFLDTGNEDREAEGRESRHDDDDDDPSGLARVNLYRGTTKCHERAP